MISHFGILLIPAFLTLFGMAQNFEKSRSVWVEQGLVRGKIYKIDGKQVQIFRGIPYAEPPIGPLRFKKPIKKQRWEREFSAIEYGPPCLQFMDFHKNDRYSAKNMRLESEDCLFLNIFSPYNPEDESQLFPILVWVHGGSFLAGSSDTGIDMETVAKNIVFRNITFISVNYRLGPLGFMTISRGDQIEGNFGLWDQKMSLEWIQRNIKQFNGDPSRVTVMGESAGAAAVSALAVSPLTKNLLTGVIAMSGSAMAGWAVHRLPGIPTVNVSALLMRIRLYIGFCHTPSMHPSKHTTLCEEGIPNWDMNRIAEYMRCNRLIPEEDLAEVLSHESVAERERKREHCNLQELVPDCLINGGNMDTDQMLQCFRSELNFSSPLFWRALSHELGVSKLVVDNDLVVESGPEMVRTGARVPMLTGVARREWAHKKPEFYQFYRYANLTRAQVEDSVRKVIETAFVPRLPAKVSNSTVDLITNATFLRYMTDVEFNYDLPGTVTRLQDLEADIEFVSPCHTEVEAYAASGQDVFVYSFDYVPRGVLVEEEKRYYSLFGDNTVSVQRKDKSTIGHKLNAFHGLDHAFIFTQGYSSNFHINPFAKRDRVMSRILTKMITNFVSKGNPSTENFTWPAYKPNSMHYASLDLPPRMIHGMLHFPTPYFWNEEVQMLSKYTLAESKLSDQAASELSHEERIQLEAFSRSWYALWLLVFAIGLVIWVVTGCVVWHQIRSPTSKPYSNIVLNK